MWDGNARPRSFNEEGAMANGDTIDQVRELLANKQQISTKAALLLTLSLLEQTYSMIEKQDGRLGKLEKKMHGRYEPLYSVILWVGSAVGLAIISFIGALITGRAQIVFGGS
jgi:hypothetical protein